MPQANENTRCKGSSGKRKRKLDKIPAWQLTKVRNKSEVIAEARNKGIMVHFASLMDLCHFSRIRSWNHNFKNYRGRDVLRGDIVKDDSGSHAAFTEQGSSASQMTAAKVMDIISRLPGCAGQAADAMSAFPGQNGRCTITGKKSKVRMSSYLDTSTETQMAQIMVQYGRSSRFSGNEICMVILWRDYYGKGNSRKLKKNGWEKFQIGNAHSLTEKKAILVCVCGRCQTGRKETEE